MPNRLSLLIFFIVAISSLDNLIPGVRYLKYCIPFICLVYWLSNKNLTISTPAATKPFLALLLLSIPTLPFANTYGLEDTFFYLTALSPFLLVGNLKLNPNKAFYILCIIYTANIIPKLLTSGFYYSFLDSSSAFEHHTYAFVFGVFAAYFIATKNHKTLFLCLIFCALSLKRVSILALIIVYTLSMLPKGYLKHLLKPWRMVVLNLLSIFITYFVTTSAFNDLCIEYFDRSASFITMGRNVLYGSMFGEFFLQPHTFLIGIGLGETYTLASESIDFSTKVNIHNDITKIFVESGVLVFILFFYYLYKVNSKQLLLVVYINIVFFTDNVTTYVLVMYVFFYLMQTLQKESSSSNLKTHKATTHYNGITEPTSEPSRLL